MADVFTIGRYWWVFVLRGALGILFGILVFAMPKMALLTLVFLFGAFAVVEGVLNVLGAFQRAEARARPWWALLLWGALSILAGVVAFAMPGATALALLVVIAAWAIVTGIADIAAAIRIRKEVQGEWMIALAGVLSVAFGVLLLAFPGAGALAVLLWIGAYAVVTGVLFIGLGVKLRRGGRLERPGPGFRELRPSESA